MRRVKAIVQAKQGQWTNWEGVESCRITWIELWEMKGKRLSNLVSAVYVVLPTPKNLNKWLGKDLNCQLCHISKSCKSETHSVWMQDKSGTRLIYVET